MLKDYLRSSIGRKQVVALTGLLLLSFLAFHLAMNLLIFLGPQAYNFFPNLAHKSGVGLIIMEVGLACVFLIHILLTLTLVLENRKAKGTRYVIATKRRSLSARLMPITGSILILFLILHIFDYVIPDTDNLYQLVSDSFTQSTFRPISYIIAVMAVGFHLSHGIQSVFQSFGWDQGNYRDALRLTSIGIGSFFAIGFGSIPAYFIISKLT